MGARGIEAGLAIVAGILILAIPNLLSYFVGIYLIVVGILRVLPKSGAGP